MVQHFLPQKFTLLYGLSLGPLPAGLGIISQERLISWFLVWRYQKSVMQKNDLIAVRIRSHSTSMLPTLRPEDIVLVDRQDIDCATPGKIMLALVPDGASMIKRVALSPIRKDGGCKASASPFILITWRLILRWSTVLEMIMEATGEKL